MGHDDDDDDNDDDDGDALKCYDASTRFGSFLSSRLRGSNEIATMLLGWFIVCIEVPNKSLQYFFLYRSCSVDTDETPHYATFQLGL